MDEPLNFQRGLKSRHVNLIALGGIIGSAYFLGTGYILNQLGPSIFLAYVLGGIITFITMAALAELTVAVPAHGSFITYVTKFVSPTVACGVGWSYWISWVVFIPSECLAAGILFNHYAPDISVSMWTIFVGLFITIINLAPVKYFGEVELWLSLIKIGLLVGFAILAFFIFFGITGTQKEALDTKYLFDNGGLFPNGYAVFFINMVVLLTNFQGSEIIGLSASESHDPHTSVPNALRKIAYRICFFYLAPTFLLAAIFPWQDAGLSGSVFAEALNKYGFTNLSQVFTFLIIAGAISCAGSGLYATTRSMHALALSGMSSRHFKEITSHGIPVKATLMTLGAIWALILIGCLFPAHALYAALLAISGFTGIFCWLSICVAQLRFRRGLQEKAESLQYKIPLFPYLTHFAIWAQVICLLVVAFSPTLRISFYLGMPALLIPMLLYWYFKKR
jgi:AAT family amino acid transporter